MKNFLRFTSVALALAAGPVMVAQSATGSLNGVVKNGSGAPVAGAKVIVSSPALFTPKTIITNAAGEWRALLLPPGDYEIQASREGHITAAARGVRLGLGAAIRQELILKGIEVKSATVEVVAAAGSADKSDTKTSVNFSSATLETIPTGAGGDRAFKGALSMAPGVVTETPSGRASVRGGTVQGVNYRVNGADIKNDYQGEMGEDNHERWVVEDNIEDVQVVLSPLHARNGRNQGGSVNIVTKSGGNDFHGSARITMSRDSWRALGPNDTPGSTDNRVDTFNKDIQLTLGGPIIKDRLWFNIATIITPESAAQNVFNWFGPAGWQRSTWGAFATGNANIDHVTGAHNGGVFSDPVPAPGVGVPAGYTYDRGNGGAAFTQVSKNSYLEAKVSGAITPDHVLELAMMQATDQKTNNDANNDVWHTTRLAALGTSKLDRYNYALSYNGAISQNLMIEGKYSTNGRKEDRPKGDMAYGGGLESVYAYGSGNGADHGGPFPNWRHGMPFGAWASPGKVESKSTSASLNVKYIIESHEFDFGYDNFTTDYMTDSYLNLCQRGSTNRQFNIGGQFSNAAGNFLFPVIRWTGLGNLNAKPDGYFDQDASLAPTMIQYLGPKDAHTKTNNSGFYVNDLWTINQHFNVMVGLRFESQKLEDAYGVQIAKSNDVSPRLQVRYDIGGDSRRLITATFADYVGDFSQAFASAFSANALSKAIFWGMTHTNGGTVALPTPGAAGDLVGGVDMYGVRFIDYATLTDSRNYQAAYRFSDAASMNVLDGSLKSPKMREMTLGYSHAFLDGSNLRLTYVNRNWSRQWAISQDYNVNEQVLLQDPGSGQSLAPMYGQKTHFFNSDDLKRCYNALEVEWNVKTKGVWSWGGSWSYSRLTGNDESGEDIASKSALRDNAITALFRDSIRLNQLGISRDAYAPDGRLGGDLTNRIRLFATATVPFAKGGEMSFSWVGSYAGGQPFDASNGNMSLGYTNLGTDAAGHSYTSGSDRTYRSYYLGRRPFEQNDIYRVDFKFAFKVPLGFGRTMLFGDVMVQNFFNTVREGQFVTDITADASGVHSVGTTTGDPNYTDNRIWTRPRTVTASVGLRF